MSCLASRKKKEKKRGKEIMPSTPPPSEQITQIFHIISEALSIPSSSEEEEENFLPHETWKYHGLTGLLASATASDISRYLAETATTETTTGGGGSSSKREVPQNVFERYPTVGEFRRWIFGVLGEKKEEGEGEGKRGIDNEQEPENPWEGIPKPKVPLSVVLQGEVSTASKIVFLFPDGSGAGTAYGSLPDLGGGETETEKEGGGGKGGGICIIGLNSPFLRQAQNFTCSIERMTRLWYDEVRKLQAQSHQTPTKEKQKRPYILGGWSAGGYYSYEMAKLLTGAGEIVSTLILIDSPCRLLYEALPVQVVEELTKKGLMGASSSSSSLQQKKSAPEWLVQHFTSTVLSVQRYTPVAMRESRVPENVYCIWVEEGLVETSVEESGLDVDVNVRVTRFLLEGRRGKKKLESEGWERLLPGAEFGFEYMTGNHFQITQVPHVRISFFFFSCLFLPLGHR